MNLKPCPFCGGEAQINERYRSGIANRKMYWVSCKACGISQQHDNTSGYRYESKAIDRWNKREPIDKVVEQLGEMYKGFCSGLDSDICDIDLCNKYNSCMSCFYSRTLEIVKEVQNG